MTVKERWRRWVSEIEAAGTTRGRARSRRCSLEGTRLFERALRSGVRIERAVCSEAFYLDGAPRTVALRDEILSSGGQLSVVPDAVMTALTEGRSIGEVVGLAPIPEAPSLEELLAQARGARPLMLGAVALDDPGNVGALVRTAHASGALAVLSVGSTDAFHPRAVRTSMGSVFRLPVLHWPTLEALVRELRAVGVTAVGAVARGGTPLPQLALGEEPVAALIGSEAFGLSDGARETVDACVSIPMAAGVDSFSVNAAAAVLLYGLGQAPGREGAASSARSKP